MGEDFSLPRKPSISNDKLVKYCRNGGFPNQLYLCIFTDFLLFFYHVWLLCWYSNPAAVVFIWSNFAGAWWGLFRSVKRKKTWREHWPSGRPPCFQEAYIVEESHRIIGTPSHWCTWMYHAMKCNERRSPLFRWIKWTSTGEFGYFWLWVKHDDFHSAVAITFKKKLLGRLGSNLYCKYVLVENFLRTAPMINVIG